jgi:hypothetical protein
LGILPPLVVLKVGKGNLSKLSALIDGFKYVNFFKIEHQDMPFQCNIFSKLQCFINGHCTVTLNDRVHMCEVEEKKKMLCPVLKTLLLNLQSLTYACLFA